MKWNPIALFLFVVRVGSLVGSPPPIPLHCMIVGDRQDSGIEVYPHTSAEIEEMIARVDQVYEQAAIKFMIASLGVTNYSNVGEIYSNEVGRLRQICSAMEDTDGLELYFVPRLVGARGIWMKEGIVISGHADFRTVAHEIGHALGFPDIYVSRIETRSTVQGEPAESRMPLDHGLFHEGAAQSNIVQRLLMYGEWNETKARIPRGGVYGLWIPPVPSGDVQRLSFSLVPVGMFDVTNRAPRSL